jgi:hypothetical protein
MVDADIRRYYARGGEVTRLASGTGRLEFLRTWDVLERVLPPAPARVLDVGGATGVYTFNRIVDATLATGEHRNIAERTWFSTAYFHRPEDIAPEATDAGLDVERLVGVETGMWLAGNDLIDSWLAGPDRAEHLLYRLRQIESEPSVIGASSHILAVARRPA